MKNIIYKSLVFFVFAVTVTSLSSCESFLEKQEDEQMTFEKIWESREETKRYWLNAMSFMPSEVNEFSARDPFLAASDEATVGYKRDYDKIIFGSWNPTSVPYQTYNYDNMYKGIRECNIFMQNVLTCSDPTASEEELWTWYYQARFARAYYYFCMIRMYGPVFLIGDEILDFNLSPTELARPRNTWEQCADYVVSEMEECKNSKYIKRTWESPTEYGLATKGACQAVVARLLLYSARDLFNGNQLYAGVRNPVSERYPDLSGQNLFPDYDGNKWKLAMDASKALIDNPEQLFDSYTLYRYKAPNGDDTDPYANYYGITQEPWNKEIIYSSGYTARDNMARSLAPTGLKGGTPYGAAAPTQQQVDAYAMDNGRFPITGYNADGSPIIDRGSKYPLTGELTLETWTYPAWGGHATYTITAPAMFRNREPRFYVNVFFSSQLWVHGTNATEISFAKGGNSNKTHDRPRSGYMISRFYDHTIDSEKNGYGHMTYPTFRLGEVYLNFIEAVLEGRKRGVAGITADDEAKAMKLWSDLRNRSGLPPITQSYRELGANPGYNELIELYRKERRVELSFEGLRYFDTRTWMIATETDNGPMYGMNIDFPTQNQDKTPEGFWERYIFEKRVFNRNHYLFPFPQSEVDRNYLLVQNYGW